MASFDLQGGEKDKENISTGVTLLQNADSLRVSSSKSEPILYDSVCSQAFP